MTKCAEIVKVSQLTKHGESGGNSTYLGSLSQPALLISLLRRTEENLAFKAGWERASTEPPIHRFPGLANCLRIQSSEEEESYQISLYKSIVS